MHGIVGALQHILGAAQAHVEDMNLLFGSPHHDRYIEASRQSYILRMELFHTVFREL